MSVELDDEERFRSVDLDSEFIPAYITGLLEGRDAPLDVAVAVNGRIAAVSRSFEGEGGTQFAALVPESVFRDGSNRVELFRVESARGSLGLARLGAAS